MAGDLKLKYGSTDTTAITITTASLATSSSLLVGRESTAVDNTTNLDLDHLVSGLVTTGTSPTVNTFIEVWAYAPVKVVSGTKTYANAATGSDAALTINSANRKQSGFRLLWSTAVDATSDQGYYMPPTSIAQAFGGSMPTFWGLFVTHSTAVNLNSTSGNHYFHYLRVLNQYT